MQPYLNTHLLYYIALIDLQYIMQFQFNICDYAKNFCVNKSTQFGSRASGSHLSIFRTLCGLYEQLLWRESSVSDDESLKEAHISHTLTSPTRAPRQDELRVVRVGSPFLTSWDAYSENWAKLLPGDLLLKEFGKTFIENNVLQFYLYKVKLKYFLVFCMCVCLHVCALCVCWYVQDQFTAKKFWTMEILIRKKSHLKEDKRDITQKHRFRFYQIPCPNTGTVCRNV